MPVHHVPAGEKEYTGMESTVSIDRIVEVVQRGRWMSRRDIADAMGRAKTTHVVAQIERAVRHGRLQRVPGYIDGQVGWLYGQPDTQPELLK